MSVNVVGDGDLYYFKDGEWVTVGGVSQIEATGGTESDITIDGVDYRLHVFTTSDDLVVTKPGFVEYLIVAGGGGGGADYGAGSRGGGGGGAGGRMSFVEGDSDNNGVPLYLEVGTIPAVVGAGGVGTTSSVLGATVNPGSNGFESRLGNVVVFGGGGGGSRIRNLGLKGGSGGGSHNGGTIGPNAAPQGFAGGIGNPGTTGQRYGGGGGGALVAGADGIISSVDNGTGGDGFESEIDDVATYRGGGGGGGSGIVFGTNVTDGAAGGLGGGGRGGGQAFDGTNYVVVPAENGVANTGGGGGGGAGGNVHVSVGGDGGSGVVIVRYRLAA